MGLNPFNNEVEEENEKRGLVKYKIYIFFNSLAVSTANKSKFTSGMRKVYWNYSLYASQC